MNSFDFHAGLFVVSAVLSVTGTMSSCLRNLGLEEDVLSAILWQTVAARLPPAEEPPMACFDRSRLRRDAPGPWIQFVASQESCTAAGNGHSGASLRVRSKHSAHVLRDEGMTYL